jgi:DNA polymerase-1
MKAADKPAAKNLIAGILRLVKVGKVRSIYEGIAPADDGAVHSFMNPAGTETTRFSHSSTWLFDPGSYNLATLPKKVALLDPLYNVRECIIPHRGRILGAADYSQAEARWCAYMAQDPVRMKIYEDNIDHYKYFVALMHWDDESRWCEVCKKERDSIGKVGVLSGQYQVGWKTMMEAVNDDFDIHGVAINAKTAKKMENVWKERFPATVRWWSDVEHQVLSQGYTVNPFGRKRFYFGRKDSDGARRAVVREAIADGPQSANAMMLNKALRRIYEDHDPHLVRVLLNVHDEILFDCHPRDMSKAVKAVKSAMEFPVMVHGVPLTIPAEVHMTSTNWADMKEVG